MIRLKGGRIVDPAHGRDEVGDLYIEAGRIAAPPPDRSAVTETYDVGGKVVMAGGIDIHSHIAGANVGAARLLLAERHDGVPVADALARGALPTSHETGRLYARMGYTTVVEPAMTPQGAIQTQLELSLIPSIDRAALAVLGNDDFALRAMRQGEASALQDYVARAVSATKAVGAKVINPGGVAAFKENIRSFDLDDEVPAYGVTSRGIIEAMQNAVHGARLDHPVHLHCNNLGLPGNAETAVATIEAAQGRRLHLTHLQFYSYGTSKRGGLTCEAGRVAEAVNAHKNISMDVGQVMFGPTVTISADVPRQFAARGMARPRKWIIADAEGNGFGIVPYTYSEANKVSVLQWAMGLELFLLVDDPWRVFLTTDHPNGAPFTTYPQIIHLLMDADERARWMERMPKSALRTSLLPGLRREYTLAEIAVITRAAPARLYGFRDRGHLAPGAVADIAVYEEQRDKARMFAAASLVFKDGVLIVRDGEPQALRYGRTLYASPGFDAQIEARLSKFYETTYGASPSLFAVPDGFAHAPETFAERPCSTF